MTNEQEMTALVKRLRAAEEKVVDAPWEFISDVRAILPAILAALEARRVPQLDDEVRWILGRPCFAIIAVAQILRLGGMTIAKRAEDEQAAVAHWSLCLYAKHGKAWRDEGEKELKAVVSQGGKE